MKKRIFTIMCLVVLAGCYLIPNALFAKPERLQIQSEEVQAKKIQAKALAREVDLTQVEDPQVRTALQAVFSALDLKAKK